MVIFAFTQLPHLFRFINLVENSSLEKAVISSYVKRLRIEFLLKHIDIGCEKSFIPLQNILNNFEHLSQMVGVISFQEISRNSARRDIDFSAKMFLALNSCPSFYVKLYWKAIYGGDSRIAKFTSNIVRKAKDDFKERAQKIFAKISSVLGFQHISYHYEENKSTDMNVKLKKNILDIKGTTLLYISFNI